MIISSLFILFIILIILIILYFYTNQNDILEQSFIKGYIQSDNSIDNSANNSATDNAIVDNSAIDSISSGSSNNSDSAIDNSNSNDNSNTSNSILSSISEIFKSPTLYGALGIDIVSRELVKKAVNKMSQKIAAKFAYKLEEYSLKLTARVLQKLALKEGSEVLVKLGLKAGEKAAIKAAQVAALKAGLEAGKTGGKLAAQAAGATATGPAAPFVIAAMYAFDILSLTLDLTDALIPGGSTGYSKMGTIQTYQEIRDDIQKEMEKEFKKVDDKKPFPAVIGPLDNLSTDEYKAKLTNNIKTIMNDISNPLIKPMIDHINQDLLSGKLTEKDLDDNDKMDIYMNDIDLDKITQQATNTLCTNLNGKIVDIGENQTACSFPNKDTCTNSYKWPLTEDSTETYAEFKNDVYGGSCVAASYALRGICESNNLSYDQDKGICNIDENYCKSKGADWIYNDKIKAYDCGINTGQNIAELIFGTTITRGLKQIFDPNQYEKCKPGEFDNAYSCSSCNEGEEVNSDLNTLAAVGVASASFGTAVAGAAALGTFGGLNMCYPKCKPGFHPFGANICSPDCPEGWTDDGISCRRSGYCPSDQERNGSLCYPKCKDGYSGNGPVCWENCPTGFIDNGAFCTSGGEVLPKPKTQCPDGMRDDGTSCWLDTYGNGSGYVPILNDCPSGSHDVGGTCWSNDDGHCEGGNCTTVDNGFYNYTWGLVGCSGDGPGNRCYKTWISRLQTNCTPIKCYPSYVTKNIGDRGTHCNGNDQNVAGLCYPQCKPGYHYAGGNLCEPDGGPGIKKTAFDRLQKCSDEFIDDGLLCRKPIQSITKKSYGRGAGTPDTEIQFKPNTSYGRGVGHIANTRVKQRVAAFSTSTN